MPGKMLLLSNLGCNHTLLLLATPITAIIALGLASRVAANPPCRRYPKTQSTIDLMLCHSEERSDEESGAGLF